MVNLCVSSEVLSLFGSISENDFIFRRHSHFTGKL